MSEIVSWAVQHLPAQNGRTAVVTGANSGIGLEAARGLAALGARVVMACRNADKAARARLDIASTVPGAELDVRDLDLARLASVRAFADGLDGPVHLLVNNAGVMALPERRETADGFEMQLGVNALGHFALTARLLPQLLAVPDARTVWISSIAHRKGRLRLDDLQSERRYHPWAAYQQSKLADLVLALEMQRRLTDSGADAISLAAHPGLTATDLGLDMVGGSAVKGRLVGVVTGLVGMPTWKGALPTLVAATSSTVQPADYVGPKDWGETRGMPARAEIAPQAQDLETARRFWAACEELTGEEMLRG